MIFRPNQIICLILSAYWWTTPAAADLPAGLAAFEAGNAEDAAALLRPEAEAGNAWAQFLMGELLSGGAIPRDMTAASGWYLKAAEGGVAEAQFQLGMRYAVGLGLPQDMVQGYRWLRIAGQSLGTEAAAQFIQSFVDKMSEAEVAEAEALVNAWPTEQTSVAGAPAVAAPYTRPAPSATDVLQTALQAHPCSDVRAIALGPGTWRLEGMMQGDGDAQDVLAALARSLPDQRFENQLQAVGQPVCSAGAAAARFRDRSRLTMAAGSGKTLFTDGDVIVVDITLPPEAGYLYVDYYQLDGQVVHIMPMGGASPSRTEPNGQLRLGDGSAGLTLRVGPPFGRELLTVFVAPEPLFVQPRAVVEAADAYLVDLTEETGRMAGSGGRVLADSLLITTAAAP